MDWKVGVSLNYMLQVFQEQLQKKMYVLLSFELTLYICYILLLLMFKK